MENSETVFSKIRDEENQKRKELIRKIEKITGSKVIGYASSFEGEGCEIEYSDDDFFQDILQTIGRGQNLFLILHSPGGDANTAEKIIFLIRKYYKNLVVAVPSKAKSAATLLCFGADKIILCPNSELGPITPLIRWLNPKTGSYEWRDANSFIKAYNEILEKSKDKRIPLDILIASIADVDYPFIQTCKDAVERTKEIAKTLLKNYMFKSEPNKVEKMFKKDSKFYSSFLNATSHGKMISPETSKECGLKIDILSPEDELFKNLWEYYRRVEYFLIKERVSKLIETFQNQLFRIIS